MVRRQFARGAQCSIRGAIVVALFALPSVAVAQSGRGFLFHAPNGSLTMRAGYQASNTTSSSGPNDGVDVLQRETTLGSRSFDSFNLGVDLNFALSPRLDLTGTVDLWSRSNTSEYREWEENGKPITHESALNRVGLAGGFRYNLAPRGRQISSLAFIPAKTLPYVGVTAGTLWYNFRQEGDFVEVLNDSTGDIFTDQLESSDFSFMGQAFAGVERRLNARWSLVGETRFTKSTAKFTEDYAGLGDLQLSGLALSLGATVRF